MKLYGRKNKSKFLNAQNRNIPIVKTASSGIAGINNSDESLFHAASVNVLLRSVGCCFGRKIKVCNNMLCIYKDNSSSEDFRESHSHYSST